MNVFHEFFCKVEIYSICNMYIKPAFEQAKATPPYNIRVKAECYDEKAKVPLLQDPSRPWHKNR